MLGMTWKERTNIEKQKGKMSNEAVSISKQVADEKAKKMSALKKTISAGYQGSNPFTGYTKSTPTYYSDLLNGKKDNAQKLIREKQINFNPFG